MQKKEMPYCFQKQIYKRMGLGAVFLFTCMILFTNIHNEKLFASAFLVGAVLILNILYLYIRAVKGDFVRLQGPCIKTETMGMGKKAGYIYMSIDQGIMRIPAKEDIRNILPGDMITVYMGLRTMVYQQDDFFILNDYYVMDHKSMNGKRKL